MALVQCDKCRAWVMPESGKCPTCEFPIPPSSKTGPVIAAIGGAVLVLVIVANVGGKQVPPPAKPAVVAAAEPAPAPQVAAPVEPPKPVLTPEQRQEQLRQQEIAQNGLSWDYWTTTDEVSGKNVKWARVRSINEVNFDFPYTGAQRASLSIRSHPRWGRDVILTIEKGQFLCRFDGCSVAMRFDDGKVVRVQANEAEDHSTTVLFLSGFDRFVAQAKKSKRVLIEAQFYQEGSRTFDFEVAGLKW